MVAELYGECLEVGYCICGGVNHCVDLETFRPALKDNEVDPPDDTIYGGRPNMRPAHIFWRGKPRMPEYTPSYMRESHE